MATILKFDISTNKVIEIEHSADTGKYIDENDLPFPGILVNPAIPPIGMEDMKIVGGVIVELAPEEKSARDSLLAQQAQIAALTFSFDEVSLKLPGLVWRMIEDLGLTKVERKALIRGLGDFYVFIQSGHIALAVEALNEASKPALVPQAAWDSLAAQVNYVIELNSINK